MLQGVRTRNVAAAFVGIAFHPMSREFHLFSYFVFNVVYSSYEFVYIGVGRIAPAQYVVSVKIRNNMPSFLNVISRKKVCCYKRTESWAEV